MNDIPLNFKLHYHPRILVRCYWMWMMSDFKSWPDIREVAEIDQDYFDDMMKIDQVFAYLKSQAKSKAG